METKTERIRRSFLDYSSTTQIHGFGFVAAATSKSEALVWTVAVIAFMALFVRDTVGLVEAYQRQDTTISLSISTDPNITLPKPTFCVDVHRESVLAYLKAAWPTFDDFNASLINQTCDVVTLGQADQSFWIPAYLLLASYMDADLQINQTTRIGPPSSFYSAVLNAIEACIKESNTDLFELVPVIGAAVCQSMAVQMLKVAQNGTQAFVPCQQENMLWVGPRLFGKPTSNAISGSLSSDVICFSVPFPMFEAPTQVVIVQTDRLASGFDLLRIRLYFDPNGGECLLTDPSDCQYFTATSADYLSANPMPINNVYSVALSLTYTALNRTAGPCSMQSAFDRISVCTASAIELKRACAPLSFFAAGDATTSSSIGPCTTRGNQSQYGVAEAWSQCSETMLPACRTAIYKSIPSVQMELFESESAFGNGELSLTITAQPVAYSAVTEALTLDSSGLLAALGGSMGAWFGGSIICFVHVLAFIVSSLTAVNSNRETANATTPMARNTEWTFKYCEVTPIHGLPFVAGSRKSIATIIFWLMIAAAGTVLTVRDTTVLVSTYNSQPTEVDIEFDYVAAPFDNLAVCFTISRTVSDLISRPFDGDSSSDFVQPINVTEFADTLSAFAESPAMVHMQAGRYDLAVGDLPLILTVRLYLYLNAIGDYDKGTVTWYEAFAQMMEPDNALVDEELVIIDAFVSENKLDLFALTKLVGSSFCLWINPTLTVFLFDRNTVTYTGEATNVSLCSSFDSLTWFGSQPGLQINSGSVSDSVGDKLCYSLTPFVGLLQDPQHDYLEISLAATQLTNGTVDEVQLLTDIEFDLRGGAGAVDTTFADGTSSDSRQIALFENIFTLQNRSTKVCAAIDRFSCATACAASQITNTRKCVSIAFPRSVYDPDQLKLPFCTTHQSIEYIKLMLQPGDWNASQPESSSFWSACLAACAIPCETETYKFAYSAPNANPLNFIRALTTGANFSYSMAIKSGSAPCWHFTERLSMDLQTAIWSFGGSLGLWLGASVIALAHLPIYCLSAWLSRRPRGATPE